jgi:hypothetical protein
LEFEGNASSGEITHCAGVEENAVTRGRDVASSGRSPSQLIAEEMEQLADEKAR